ncbi:MAG: hypothetical protein U0Y08_06270 [Bacteroidia bacterium]
MNRTLYLLTLLLLLSGRVTAQKLTLSADQIDNNGLDYAKVIGQDEEGVYVLMSNLSLEDFRERFGLKTRKYELDCYGYDLKLRWKKDITADAGISIEYISCFNNAVVVISSEYAKSTDEILMYADVTDQQGKQVVAKRKIYSGTLGKGMSIRKTRVLLSPDKSHLGISAECTGNDQHEIHYCSINAQFQPAVQQRGTIPYSQKDAELSDFIISNNDDLFFLCYRKQINEEKEKSKLRSFSVQLLKKGTTVFQEFPFNKISQLMTEASLVVDRVNNNAIVTGFYADKTSYAGASLLYGTINLNHPDELKVSSGKLNNDSRMKLVGQRNSGGGVSLYNYPIQRVIPRSDGGALVIAEAAYLSEYSFYDYFTQTFNRRIEFHFDNVLAISVNSDGSIDWGQLIQKEQTSMDDEGIYSSFNSILSPEALSVIFNNDIGRNNEIVCHSINAQGLLTVKKFSRTGDSISILPRSGKQVDENTMIVPAVTKKRLFLVKLEM